MIGLILFALVAWGFGSILHVIFSMNQDQVDIETFDGPPRKCRGCHEWYCTTEIVHHSVCPTAMQGFCASLTCWKVRELDGHGRCIECGSSSITEHQFRTSIRPPAAVIPFPQPTTRKVSA